MSKSSIFKTLPIAAIALCTTANAKQNDIQNSNSESPKEFICDVSIAYINNNKEEALRTKSESSSSSECYLKYINEYKSIITKSVDGKYFFSGYKVTKNSNEVVERQFRTTIINNGSSFIKCTP